MKEKDQWKLWSAAVDKIDQRVAEAIKASGQRKIFVDYSAYKEDENELPIDNLDEIPVQGKLVLVHEADDFFGGKGSRNYRSEVLESPTWLQIAVCANAMIRTTRDEHHVFLEGIDREKKQEKDDGVKVYRFSMGS